MNTLDQVIEFQGHYAGMTLEAFARNTKKEPDSLDSVPIRLNIWNQNINGRLYHGLKDGGKGWIEFEWPVLKSIRSFRMDVNIFEFLEKVQTSELLRMKNFRFRQLVAKCSLDLKEKFNHQDAQCLVLSKFIDNLRSTLMERKQEIEDLVPEQVQIAMNLDLRLENMIHSHQKRINNSYLPFQKKEHEFQSIKEKKILEISTPLIERSNRIQELSHQKEEIESKFHEKYKELEHWKSVENTTNEILQQEINPHTKKLFDELNHFADSPFRISPYHDLTEKIGQLKSSEEVLGVYKTKENILTSSLLQAHAISVLKFKNENLLKDSQKKIQQINNEIYELRIKCRRIQKQIDCYQDEIFNLEKELMITLQEHELELEKMKSELFRLKDCPEADELQSEVNSYRSPHSKIGIVDLVSKYERDCEVLHQTQQLQNVLKFQNVFKVDEVIISRSLRHKDMNIFDCRIYGEYNGNEYRKFLYLYENDIDHTLLDLLLSIGVKELKDFFEIH